MNMCLVHFPNAKSPKTDPFDCFDVYDFEFETDNSLLMDTVCEPAVKESCVTVVRVTNLVEAVCLLPTCSLPVWPGYRYCGKSHGVQAVHGPPQVTPVMPELDQEFVAHECADAESEVTL
jgi:hypothetical protein